MNETKLRMIHEIDTDRPVIAFTFDDGPDPVYTPQLLEIFREVSGKATFFMIGAQIAAYPEIAKAVADEGHEIGNHTYSHPHLTALSLTARKEELERTDQAIQSITGAMPASFRPPYLDYDQEILTLAGEAGQQAIGALNLDSRDWDTPGTEHIISTSREKVKPGSILIFHDGYGDRSQTVEAVRVLARELTEQGYRLVTVKELLELEA